MTHAISVSTSTAAALFPSVIAPANSSSSEELFDPSGRTDLGLRPLAAKFNPAHLSTQDLLSIDYEERLSWHENDGEADDLIGGSLSALGPRLFIADPHKKIADTLAKNEMLAKLLGRGDTGAIQGSAESVETLEKMLGEMEDGSLPYLLTSPPHTLARLIEKCPDLLAAKLDKIVWLSGFSYRDDAQGNKAHFSTFNITGNLEASQKLFQFAQQYKIPLYVLSTDTLRLPRHLNFDIPYKLMQASTPLADFLGSEVEFWNETAFPKENLKPKKQDKKKKLLEYAAEAGYKKSDSMFYRCSMTPADVIPAVFLSAFKSLEIESYGIQEVMITEESRPDDPDNKKVTFVENAASSIQYVKGFSLPSMLQPLPVGAKLQDKTAFAVEVLANDLVNRHCLAVSQPHNNGVDMHPVSSNISNATDLFSALSASSSSSSSSSTAQPIHAASSTSSSSSSSSAAAYALPTAWHPDHWMPALGDHRQATVEGIGACWTEFSEKGDLSAFFTLKGLLGSTKIYEYWNRAQHKPELRDEIYSVAQQMQKALNKNLDKIQDSSLNEAQKKELALFATQGAGFNSIDIYTFPLTPFKAEDPDYGSKIMQFAVRSFHVRPSDTAPGMTETCGALIPSFKKANISMGIANEELWVPSRLAKHEELSKVNAEKLSALSETLAKKFSDISFERSQTFLRGALAAGKTTYLASVLGLSEADIPVSDTLKQEMGGNLCHNEACTLFDALPKPEHSLIVKTNTRSRDNEFITAPKAKTLHRVVDITLTQEQQASHFEQRKKMGGRVPNPAEVSAGYAEAQKTRRPILEAAKANPALQWQLVENRGDVFTDVANIINKKLEIQNEERLQAVLAYDPLLAASLKDLFDYSPTATSASSQGMDADA